MVDRLVRRFHRLDPSSTYLRYRGDARPVSFDLDESQRELEDVFQRLFARPQDVEASLGRITAFEEQSHALAVREYVADEERAG